MSTGIADYARIKHLFNEVCELPSRNQQRERLHILGASPAESARVLALLDEEARTDASISLTQNVAAAVQGISQELHPGDRLGPFTLLRELGHGGMGQVFLAERSDGLYQQRVAIKMLLGPPGRDALALLARERQILARLNHPHIARLLDGGTTPQGRPYLVMEYVDGMRIDEHCLGRALDLTQRLALFAQVCEAVADAHRQLIVHCDLKPGNVLVDAQGRAKLLDFGVARLPGQEGTTLFGSSAGHTPRYASPEQLEGKSPTVSSDIFSLGRILEELVLAAPTGVNARRRAELVAVVAKASAAAPQDRYASVEALLSDLRRFEQHLPLRALAGHRRYEAGKFVRRRWPWLLAGTAVLGLSAGFTVNLIQQRDRAEREAATTREISQFVSSLFEGADPASGGRHDMTALELLDRGRDRIARELQGQPEQRSQLQAVLADVYERLGQRQRAIELWQSALTALPHSADREAFLQARLALALTNSGQYEQALKPARRALELAQARRPPDPGQLANAENRLGVVLTNLRQYDEAASLLESALTRHLKADKLSVGKTSHVLHNLARLESKRGDLTAAEGYFRRSLEAHLQEGDTPDETLNTRTELARLLADQGRYDEALPAMREVLAQREATWGPQSGLVAEALNELGAILFDAGLAQEAAPLHRRGLAIRQVQAQGQPSRDVAIARHNLGKALMALGDPEAEAQLRQSVAERVQVFGSATAAGVQPARANLIRWGLLTGQLNGLEPELQALWAERAKRPPEDADRLLAQLLQAQWLQARNDWPAAATALAPLGLQDAALKGVNRAHWLRLRAAQAEHEGRTDEALALGEQAWTTLKTALRPSHGGRLAPGLQWHDTLRRAGRAVEAQAVLQELAAAAASHVAASPWRAEYLRRVGDGGKR